MGKHPNNPKLKLFGGGGSTRTCEVTTTQARYDHFQPLALHIVVQSNLSNDTKNLGTKHLTIHKKKVYMPTLQI